MDSHFFIAICIFFGAYILISSEKMHRTKVALAGAVLMVVGGILTQNQAIAKIDFNTILLLVGMMIIVNVTRESGFFEFIAIRGVRAAKGDPWKILVTFFVLTATVSAFVDNVTTVLLFTPIILFIADILGIPAFPYLVSTIFAANIGGTATLIGAPPNIMLGSATGFSFNDFIVHIFPITVVIAIINVGLLWLLFRKKLAAKHSEEVLKLDASKAIKDKKLLTISVSILILTIVGFVLHDSLNIMPATVALAGAALILLFVPGNPLSFLEHIEWNTIFFFGGLFVLVGGIEAAGIIEWVFQKLTSLTNDITILSGITLFGSAIFCSFVDNIPFTAMMLPLIERISEGLFPNLTASPALFVAAMPLWWALSLGANLGGNGTIIASSPNVVVTGIAEESKHKISFLAYFGYGMLSVGVSTVVAWFYVWVRYLH